MHHHLSYSRCLHTIHIHVSRPFTHSPHTHARLHVVRVHDSLFTAWFSRTHVHHSVQCPCPSLVTAASHCHCLRHSRCIALAFAHLPISHTHITHRTYHNYFRVRMYTQLMHLFFTYRTYVDGAPRCEPHAWRWQARLAGLALSHTVH